MDDEDLGVPVRPEGESETRPARARGGVARERATRQDAWVPLERVEDEDGPTLPVRRRPAAKKTLLPKSRGGRILLGGVLALAVLLMVAAGFAIRHFFEHDPRFTIESADAIQVEGNSQVTRAELLGVFGGDIGRNIFYVPLGARRTELESLPWVERATVMRLLPNQLRIAVTERTPVAFVRRGNRVGLVDGNGVLLNMPPAMMAARRYSFPVVTGISAGQGPEVRADRMRLYEKFISDLNSDGGKAAQVSEVDLSDPEDVRATIPSEGTDLLVHFGEGDFARRFQVFDGHVAGWQQQYPDLAGVDLRYDHQTVLQMSKDVDAGAAMAEGGKPSAMHPAAAAHPAARPAAAHSGAGRSGAGNGAQKARAQQSSQKKAAHAVAGAGKHSGKNARQGGKSQRVSARG